jgi:RimJ/RimL family protein N-acetyltransferase
MGTSAQPLVEFVGNSEQELTHATMISAATIDISLWADRSANRVVEIGDAQAGPNCQHGLMRFEFPDRIVGERVIVRAPRPGDGSALVHAVNASLEHLRPWMPWIKFEPQTVDQREKWIAEQIARWEAGTDFSYFYVDPIDDSRIIGGTGFHLRSEPHQLDIGYWTHVAMTGRGVCTEASRLMTTIALQQPGITEVLISCDATNDASAAIPSKLGYTMIERYPHTPTAPSESGTFLRWRMTGDEWPLVG